MYNVRNPLALLVAAVLAISPVGAVQANDAHHSGTAATKQVPAKAKGKTLKTNPRPSKQSGAPAPGLEDPLHGIPS